MPTREEREASAMGRLRAANPVHEQDILDEMAEGVEHLRSLRRSDMNDPPPTCSNRDGARAYAQVAMKRDRDGTWFLSPPYCQVCAEDYAATADASRYSAHRTLEI